MSCLVITIFLANSIMFQWKMLLIHESCCRKNFMTTFTSCSYAKWNWKGKRSCWWPAAVSKYLISKYLDAKSCCKEISWPADYSWPAVKQDLIKQRICSNCGLYLGTIKAKTLYKASYMVTEGLNKSEIERVQPLRNAACRQRELLCVMGFQGME